MWIQRLEMKPIYNLPEILEGTPLRRAGLTVPKLSAMSLKKSKHHLNQFKSYVLSDKEALSAPKPTLIPLAPSR